MKTLLYTFKQIDEYIKAEEEAFDWLRERYGKDEPEANYDDAHHNKDNTLLYEIEELEPRLDTDHVAFVNKLVFGEMVSAYCGYSSHLARKQLDGQIWLLLKFPSDVDALHFKLAVQ
jgi:hypothetical protein